MKHILKRIKNRWLLRQSRRNNTIIIPKKCKAEIIVHGKNNTVQIEAGSASLRGRIRVYGDNNHIHIQGSKYRACLWMMVGLDDKRQAHRICVNIGKNLYCGKAEILLADDDCQFKIGDDCMFSDGVLIYGSDTHTITDLQGKRVNYSRFITIGNHVWLGRDTQVLKNTVIPDDCIVGLGSIVSKGEFKPHSAIAGTPAKTVKENVSWDRTFPGNYEQRKENIL